MLLRLRKTVLYKSGSFAIVGLVTLIFTENFLQSLGVAAIAESLTFIFYYFFECVWDQSIVNKVK